MKISNAKFSDLKIIKGITRYDKRGYLREILKNNFFKDKNFIFWIISKSKKDEMGILCNDKSLKIKWPTTKPIPSRKVKNNITFEKFNNF